MDTNQQINPNQIQSSLNGRSIVVTGASGFLGVRLVDKLVNQHGAKVTALIRSKRAAQQLLDLNAATQITDLGNAEKLKKALEGAEFVFNLAYDFKANAEKNLSQFENLISACLENKVEKVIQVSSIATYDQWPGGHLAEQSPAQPEPGADYKNAKIAMDEILLAHANSGQLASTIIQPTLIYGPNSRFWTDDIIEQLTTGTVILPDDGKGSCPAVYVDDVIDALILAATQSNANGEKYIISGPKDETWAAFLNGYQKVLGIEAIKYMPSEQLMQSEEAPSSPLKSILTNPLKIAEISPFKELLGLAQNLVGKERIASLRRLVINLKQKRGPITYYPDAYTFGLYTSQGTCSIEKAKAELGYQPKFDLVKGMAASADYITQNFSKTK